MSSWASPKQPSITNLSLMPQLKPKSKDITTSSRRQRRHHHVGTATRERKLTRVLFPARPRTPAPSQSRRCRAWEPRSSGGPGSQRVSNVLLFQLHGDGVEENAAAATGVEDVSHRRSVTDRAAHTPSLVPMETMGRVKHAVGGKEEADGRDGRGDLHVWTPCVQKGDFKIPCRDRCGKGSHICMAPMHPKQKGRAYARRKGVSTPWSSYN
uniref:Uncharacterized protein n=1 Tax=Vitis vinifera TaxID=29760 RepID=A5B674_VITVI|nr:hypothetical protein VITISV_004069 [Vitis vinifera]